MKQLTPSSRPDTLLHEMSQTSTSLNLLAGAPSLPLGLLLLTVHAG